ncbi:peroxide stress protein YaaA [Cryobacterium melibiosiphilum]|uniref:Peroxide stress protein YaaA n=1 Tax=Cryobacterium melibiosiphilum TaxID=995039 RepID=A0A3A5MI00_9MICO|nr:peroxide stress protein YaaA [Cryobacterium melibiosiphilum]RJT87539.1 peroxide stress protein YaaA [Cryobacterium melibiosiphilum]
MLVLIPPSETKRSGGGFLCLDWAALSYPTLTTRRRSLARALVKLSKQPESAMAALKLGRTQGAEVERNRLLLTSPAMAAMDRYTGVLYDALETDSLSPAARVFAGDHLVVHSALFGPLGALDAIPAYRLSHDSRVPEHPLKAHWTVATTKVLSAVPGLVLDLRSEGYVSLGAAPVRSDSVFLRVVTVGTDGHARAINHFNKKWKGLFTRALLEHGEDFATVDDLLAWAPTAGFTLRPGAAGTLLLVV